MYTNHDDTTITHLLHTTYSIAIIGAKDNPSQPVNTVGSYLLAQGYKVIPVHPVRKTVWNISAFTNVVDIPFPIDLVVVFRAPEYCANHAREILEMQTFPKAFWMQEGIRSLEATKILHEQGLMVIEDRCIKIEHKRLAISPIPQAFDCQQCGDCCLGKGGIILTIKDIDRLAKALHIPQDTFLQKYTEKRQGKPSLIANDENTCIFFNDQEQCMVHTHKPDICRAWPFFSGNMRDKTSFEMAKCFCHGINQDISHDAFIRAGHISLNTDNIAISADKSQPNALKPISP